MNSGEYERNGNSTVTQKGGNSLRNQVRNSIILGVIFAVVTLGAGFVLFEFNGTPSLPTSSVDVSGMFLLSIMIAVVAGYYLGISLTENEGNAYLLFTYFTITMIAVILFVFRSEPLLYIFPPLTTVGIGFAIYNNNIEIDEVSGAVLNAISKIFISIISTSVNTLFFKPLLEPFIGVFSYSSYAWVIIVIIILIYRFIVYYNDNF